MEIILSGGLGNQMFQYAFYLSLKHLNKNVKINTLLYSHINMHNGYELDKCFEINEDLVKYNFLKLLYIRLLLKLRAQHFVCFDKLKFDSNIYNSNKSYYFGYWQSEKYFYSIKPIIYNKFEFKYVNDDNKKIAENIKNSLSVSIHLRRGDYNGNSIYSDICTFDYYNSAITLIKKLLQSSENLIFYIFSDDKDYSSIFVDQIDCKYVLVQLNTESNSHLDMYLMSCCKHNVIANSSFSWWGAWLNKNPDKIVIAPKKWFNTSNVSSYYDIVPEEWFKI